MSDSVHDLGHDHHEINRQVLAVGALIRRLESEHASSSPLVAALGDLRELLFLHFAREEEGLFPFIAESMPTLAERAKQMATAHDTICGALVRTVHLASSSGEAAAIVATFERFDAAYASHAALEAALLDELNTLLSEAQRVALAQLIDGL